MKELERLQASVAGIDRVVEIIREDGAVVVEGMLAPDVLGRFNADLDPILGAAAPDHGDSFVNPSLAAFFGKKTRHVTGVAGRSSTFATEIMNNPIMFGVCDAFLLPACARYVLNLAHVIDRGPGAAQQWPHRDDEGWAVYLDPPHPELQVAAVYALVDFTADNGATVVAPGSHRWDRGRETAAGDLQAVAMPAGSAVIYLGSTVHAGGANTTSDQWRRGMQVSYALGWLRTEENHYLTTPPDAVRRLPLECQKLIGYATHDAVERHGGALGHVDLREPYELIAEGVL